MASRVLSDEDIAFVCDLVEKAGILALSMREGVEVSCKGSPDDKVTGADVALSELITTALTERFSCDCVVSEEHAEYLFERPLNRVWMIDPIDGTQNYILDDGQYCVMVGLLLELKPYFGWVYEPHSGCLYYGGPDYGSFKRPHGRPEAAQAIAQLPHLEAQSKARLLMGSRDRKKHPWVKDIDRVNLVKIGSIGLKVVRILDKQADIFIHLSRKLKIWDTAAPAALALGAGLEVGGIDEDSLHFPLPAIIHDTSVIMGRPGALNWCRKNLIEPSPN
jgi:3'(2'), 5'-bisphosphate nucleotidase